MYSKPQTPLPFSEPEQSGIKTEVLLAEELFSETAEPEKPIEEDEGFSADATLPLLKIDSQPDKLNSKKTEVPKDSASFDKGKSEPVPAVLPPSDFSDNDEISEPEFSQKEEEVYDEPEPSPSEPVYAQPEAAYAQAAASQYPKPAPSEKKSGGKTFLILGGLFAFFILALGAGAGGWYAYHNYIAVSGPDPTPEVTPSVAATPELTPELTPEPTLEANSMMEDSNTNLPVDDNTNADTNSPTENINTPTVTQTPRQVNRSTTEPTGSTPRTPPQTVTDKTPKVTQTPPKKTPTPKKKPTPDIFQ